VRRSDFWNQQVELVDSFDFWMQAGCDFWMQAESVYSSDFWKQAGSVYSFDFSNLRWKLRLFDSRQDQLRHLQKDHHPVVV